ncbi:MAG TPA: nuclear transport factor 2 family protein [Cellulomonas sp.]
MDATDTTVVQLVDAYRSAVLAKDVDALLALYAPDVRVYDLWGAWSSEGADAWRESVAAWFSSLGEETVHVTMSGLRAQLGTDLAVVEGMVRYEGRTAEGDRLRSMSNRLTWVLVPGEDETWRIVHEHTSAPVHPETGEVILQR